MNKVLKKAGQLFVVGFKGETPPKPFLEFLREEQIGGVILFADNCATHQSARSAIEKIRGCYRHFTPLIAIDQEGGRVCRLKGAPVEFRAASEYASTRNVERFTEEYSRAAVYMEALGINLNLAPVSDIYTNPKNTVLKDRCYGTTVAEAAEFIRASISVSRASGLLSCLKHFPGLGEAVIDPHYGISSLKFDEMVWEQREKRAFEAGIDAQADLVMTTHVTLPELDDKIVTGSEKIITQLLRQELNFDGPIITDDLCMQGASQLGTIGERTVAAFNAGHDLLLFGQDTDASMQAFDYFCDAARRGEINPHRIAASLDRIGGAKFRLGRSVTQ
ncbi:MAG: glycoside hydrolase family 3 N-terminal domain-containing protein [Candidatus Zixiibacteriota bacterium]